MQHFPWYRRLAVVVLLLSLAPDSIYAAPSEASLYRAQVIVADQTEAARIEGFRAALAQVVVKLSGQRRVLDLPQVAPLLEEAAELVEEYRYQPVPAALAVPEASNATPSVDATPSSPPDPETALEVRFAAAILDAELRRLGVPRWPAERRPVLLWIGGADPERSLIAPLAREALAKRGVPALEPLGDLEDTQALGASAQGLDPARVAEASRRYEASQWLILEPRVTEGAVRGQWRLGGVATAVGDETTGAEPRAWVEAAVDAAIDALAVEQVYVPGGQTQIEELGIDGVATYDAYRAAVGALEALEVVRALEVKALSGGRMTLRLQLDGEPGLLWRALANDARFAEVTDVAAGAGRLYLWRGP